MASPVEDGLKMLARHPYTSAEVRAKLIAKGYGPEAIGQALGRLAELGYLDDFLAAQATVRLRMRSPRGRRAVAREIFGRGCSAEVVEAALADFDEEEAARTFIARELRGGRGRDAIIRHMRARGFPDTLIIRLLGEVAPLDADTPGGEET